MTSGSVNDFVSSLVEMAKAKELVPQLEEDIRALVKETDSKTIHIQELELNIIGYKQQIEQLQATRRELEAARDDAEYRFLEAEDRQHTVLASVHSAQADLAVILAKLDPPKPVPVVEEVKPITHNEAAGISRGLDTTHDYDKATDQWYPKPIDPPIDPPQAVPAEVTEAASPAFATTGYAPYDWRSEPINEVGVSQPVEVKTSTDAEQSQSATDPTPETDTYSTKPAISGSSDTPAAGPASQSADPDPYSAEPDKYTRAWYHWADEMDSRYGVAGWPVKRSA